MSINNLNNYKIMNNIFLFILSFFIIAQIYGPSLINFFHLLLLSFFIFFVKKKKITYEIKFNFLFFVTISFLIYLVLNSYFLTDHNSFFKSIFYFRFVIFSLILFKILEIIKNQHLNLSIFFLISSLALSLDIIYQSITGYDIFGYIAGQCDFPGGIQYLDPKNCERFSGFFGEEYIAGSFLVSYGLFFLYFYYLNSSKKTPNMIFIILSLILIILSIIISGERNALLSLILIVLFNLIFNKKIRKYIFALVIFLLLALPLAVKNYEHIKHRYIEWPSNYLSEQTGNTFKKLAQTPWGAHYVTAYDIYLDHKIFGSGFKSFRKICRDNKYDFGELNKKYDLDLKHTGCSTHPHNIYFELLAETGIIGFVIFNIFIFSIIIVPLYKNYKNLKDFSSIVLILSIIFTFLFPLRPTGSFSSTIYMTNLFFFIGFYFYFVSNKYKY